MPETPTELAAASLVDAAFERAGLPTLLTLRAAARAIDCHPDTLRVMIREGRLQAVRPAGERRGGHYRVLRRQLAEYVAGAAAESRQ
jgi:excisionase family DNA binding protein